MVFRKALSELTAREAANGEGDVGPAATVVLAEGLATTDVRELKREDVERLAMATLASATPGALCEEVSLGGRRWKRGVRVCTTIVTGGAGCARVDAFRLVQPLTVLNWARTAPLPLELIFWRPRDSQALERAWRSLNRCKSTLRGMRPNVHWFFLHLIADGRNNLLRDGRLFARRERVL